MTGRLDAPTPRPTTARLRPPVRALLISLVVAVALAFAALPRIEAHYLERAGAADRATLRLATEVLRGALERTQALPALIAERPILAQLLHEPGNSGLVPFTNELLRQSALSLDVSDIYVMDLSGRTVATSNYRSDHSFLGRSFAFRPYFTDAMSLGFGRFHALGTTSNQRGYFFAAPVIAETERLGAVAVKITLDRFEETWGNSESTIIVTDTSNVIFLSDRTDWHFRTLGPVPEPAIEAIAETQQYPLGALRPLQVRRSPLGPETELVTVTGPDGSAETFVFQTALIAAPGWRVSILTPTAPAIAQAWTVFGLLLLLIAAGGLLAAVLLQRRAQLMERLALQRSQKAELEARVQDRTRDLDAANAQPARSRSRSVARRGAPAQARRPSLCRPASSPPSARCRRRSATSSTSRSPPSKSYADNAAPSSTADRIDEARENIGRISAMADRMASISRHLRNFARRPLDKTGPVPLARSSRDALELMRRASRGTAPSIAATPRARGLGDRRARAPPAGRRQPPQQRARRHGGQRPIGASTSPCAMDGPTCAIEVRDRGPGLSEEALAQAFDPFFTTKPPGQGLGLGLSISYNIVRDFDGRLSAANHPGGGAVFTVELAAPRRRPATWPPNDGTVPGCVLFVDDEEHLRLAAEQALMLADLDVILCDRRRGALERPRTSPASSSPTSGCPAWTVCP
jgi:two-component system, NtrC family, C4-dicarboxylate transport sensor histidine kinase DctB